MDTMLTAETTVIVPVDRLQKPIIRFVNRSALADVTSMDIGRGGWAEVIADRPVETFSTHERQLWDLLISLVRGPMRDLLCSADIRSLTALSDMFTTLTIGAF